jgi:hypothetical protein
VHADPPPEVLTRDLRISPPAVVEADHPGRIRPGCENLQVLHHLVEGQGRVLVGCPDPLRGRVRIVRRNEEQSHRKPAEIKGQDTISALKGYYNALAYR